MLPMSTDALLEKNKIESEGSWLLLVEIQLFDITVRLVRNTEDINWGGHLWTCFPFELGDATEDTKQFPEIELKVSNVTRYLQPYLENYKGCVGSTVIIRVVHSSHLTSLNAELEETFSIVGTSTDTNFVTFKLGADFNVNVRIPQGRYLKNFCCSPFKSISCGYNGGATTCDRTLNNCRALGNSVRFGGYPSIPLGGLYV